MQGDRAESVLPPGDPNLEKRDLVDQRSGAAAFATDD